MSLHDHRNQQKGSSLNEPQRSVMLTACGHLFVLVPFCQSRVGCPHTQAGTAAELRISIAPNPSHLEAVAPVVLGLVRAEQARKAARNKAIEFQQQSFSHGPGDRFL